MRLLKRSYYRGLLLSYLFAVATPVCILCLLLYQIGVVQLREQFETTQRLLMEQASETIDQSLREINEVAISVSMDQELLRLSADVPVVEIRDGIERLRKYMQGNAVFENITIRREGEELLYTAYGVELEEVFLNQRYRLSSEEQAHYHQLLSSGDSHLVYFPHADRIMKLMRVPVFSRKNNDYAIFTLDYPVLDRLFADHALKSYSVVALLDSERRVISISSSEHGLVSDSVLQQCILEERQGILVVDGKKYTLITEEVDGAGWRMLAILNCPHCQDTNNRLYREP